jgi:cytoskeletal protein RodZ
MKKAKTKFPLHWTLLAVALLAVVGVLVLRNGTPNNNVNNQPTSTQDKQAYSQLPGTVPGIASAALPRLLQLRSGAD